MEQDTLLMLLRVFDEVEEINVSSDQEAIELFKEIMRLKEDEQEEQ